MLWILYIIVFSQAGAEASVLTLLVKLQWQTKKEYHLLITAVLQLSVSQ